MDPRPRFFGDLAFNLLLGVLISGLLGIIAFGTLSPQGDFAKPFLTMMCVAPVLALALLAAVLGRLAVITRGARAQAKIDRMMAKIDDDTRR